MFDKGNRIEASGHDFRIPATNFFDNSQLNLAHSRDFAFLIVNVSISCCMHSNIIINNMNALPHIQCTTCFVFIYYILINLQTS